MEPESAPTPDKFTIETIGRADREVLSKLRQAVTFDCDGLSLPEVLRKLEALTKVTFTIKADDLATVKRNPKATVTGKWKRIPAEDVLRDIITQTKSDYIVEAGRILIVSQRRAIIDAITLTYNVEKLCPDVASLERLRKAVYNVGDDDEWDSAGGFANVSMEPIKRTLTIKQTWSRHSAIRNAFREFSADE